MVILAAAHIRNINRQLILGVHIIPNINHQVILGILHIVRLTIQVTDVAIMPIGYTF